MQSNQKVIHKMTSTKMQSDHKETQKDHKEMQNDNKDTTQLQRETKKNKHTQTHKTIKRYKNDTLCVLLL